MAFFFSNIRAVSSPQVGVSCQEQAIPARYPESLVFVLGAGVGVLLLLGCVHACLGCCDGAHVAPVAYCGNVAVLHLVLWPIRHLCRATDQSQHMHECPGVLAQLWASNACPTCVHCVCPVWASNTYGQLGVQHTCSQHVYPVHVPNVCIQHVHLTHASNMCGQHTANTFIQHVHPMLHSAHASKVF